ncbi:hypothetical protein [Celeribacter indicus]|uniref:Pentapeptide repeat-containing protein n=1 Tax=Celeribacter indicus TaxID=1208324 RepID=A0A0B5E1E4_9RHOB|nr:hypothetical protein [Celeribacter indicus]AJE46287.1 pentapeptide repeat-containing protein [Celeribacter indicus]SDW52258.1 hypothetical protein SAMN05443573_104121 [Celeribacter indicus]
MTDLPDLPDLTSDCSRCAALCCVGLRLEKGELFAFDKPAGAPCPNLEGHLCAIHDRLAESGNPGCVLYDCAGAGQRVVQMRFNGESWREDPTLLPAMLRDFAALKPLHERMAQLVEAGAMDLPPELEAERLRLLRRCARLWSDSDALAAGYAAFLDRLAPFAAR